MFIPQTHTIRSHDLHPSLESHASVQCSASSGSKAGIAVYRQESFNISRTLLTSLGFPIDQFSSITFNNSDEFVFVTAASDNHFYESLDAIARLQLYFPRHIIYFYDLSINTSPARVSKVTTRL